MKENRSLLKKIKPSIIPTHTSRRNEHANLQHYDKTFYHAFAWGGEGCLLDVGFEEQGRDAIMKYDR